MANPFPDHPNTERAKLFNDQADNLENAPLNPYQNELGGIVGYEDGSVLIDASQINSKRPSKRQVFNRIFAHKLRYNKTVILDDTGKTFTNIFVKELLQDEYLGGTVIRTEMNILEVEQGSNFRSHIRGLPPISGDKQFYKLLVKDIFDYNIHPMRDIIRDKNINLLFSYIDQEILPNGENRWVFEHLEFLEECVGDGEVPIVAVLECSWLQKEESEAVNVIIAAVFDREEEDRMVVTASRPSTALFEPFYLYADGTFVYKSDCHNSEIMNTLGKRIIHPEE